MAIRDDFTAGEVLAAADLNDTFAAKLNLAGGKILQIVRATDATDRTTTSTSFVDASISVTITPQKSDSAILLINTFYASSGDAIMTFTITDASNNSISGAQAPALGATYTFRKYITAIAYSTPATTAATTYKLRFRTNGNSVNINNASSTGQMYAIEVSA
jgi:hypothetical protein